ncbi:MAG: papain-like cysteine protease family protein [Ginsengibacter sp.]
MSNTVELIPQDKSNACWLASSSMMETWKTGTHHSLEDTLKILDASGTSFSNIYNNDQGLSFANDNIITKTLGLTQLPPASYTIEYLTSILDQSPLMAVIMYASTSNIAHMIIITGISGDGTPQGTTLQINDPLPLNAGKTYTIAFNDFLSKFEQVVAYENNWPGADLTSQLFYFPASANSSSSSGSASDTSGSSSGDASDSGTQSGTTDTSAGNTQNDSSSTSTDNSSTDSSTNSTTNDSQNDTTNTSSDATTTGNTDNTSTDGSQNNS